MCLQKGHIMKTSEIDFSGITLRSLRAMLPGTEGLQPPSEIWFRENPDQILCFDYCGDGLITVYSNGFYTYTEDDGEHITILRVDGFKRLRYDFVDNTAGIVEESDYIDSPYLVALYINGKTQWDINASKRSMYRHGYYLENNSKDWGSEAMVPSAEDEYIARETRREERFMLSESIAKLTKRQRQIVKLYFDDGMKQEAIAKLLGVRQQSVMDVLSAAIKNLRNNFRGIACNIPLIFGE